VDVNKGKPEFIKPNLERMMSIDISRGFRMVWSALLSGKCGACIWFGLMTVLEQSPVSNLIGSFLLADNVSREIAP
jgi:hypothetical protein